MERPFGRGINFQIEVPSVQLILELFVEPEARWYQAGDIVHGQLQFLVQDPDGYLLRLVDILGEDLRE